ncbi:MAG: hypothetical protein M9941_05145 [Anaerolineae bacterium]|nr:hypothetical protein [Anaerolineae bacterium]
MSLAHRLAQNTLDAIIGRFDLTEHGNPYKVLSSPMSPEPVGTVRLFSGGPIHKLVYIGLAVPMIGLDSHMVFAFTAPDSAVPHFTLDSVLAGPHFAFHLDLIPRVDLGANLAYIDEVMHPLTPLVETARDIEGLERAHLTPRQLAVMSPWMLAYRASEDAFAQIDGHVAQYMAHWFDIVERSVSAETIASLDHTDFATRDQRNRNAIFDPEVDKVWAQVARLVGDDTSEELRELLRTQALPA